MKNGDLSIVFSVQGTGGSPTGPDPENREDDQDIRSPGRPVSSGLKVPDGARAFSYKNKTPLGQLTAAFFLQNVLQLHQQRLVILRVDSLALWKIINEEDAVLIPKIEARTFPADFYTRNFMGWGEPLCRNSINCSFVPGS